MRNQAHVENEEQRAPSILEFLCEAIAPFKDYIERKRRKRERSHPEAVQKPPRQIH